jgi:hypothetical protein
MTRATIFVLAVLASSAVAAGSASSAVSPGSACEWLVRFKTGSSERGSYALGRNA